MADTPFEISVTLNATSQMLESVKPPYTDATAVAPSAQLENIRGYDVEVDFLKSTFLQFKRPYTLNYKREPFSFHTDHKDQLETLKKWARHFPRSVFYAFPLVPRENRLNQTLERTLFVDVDCLKDDTSRVRVYTKNSASTSRESPEVKEVKGKVQNGDWYQLKISRQCCFTWDEFEQGLTSSVSGLEPWVETEFEGEQWLPVGMTLFEEGEPTTYLREDSRQTVQEKMGHIVRENDLTFWEQGLEAGMFGR
jgi:hypothetical protein